MDWLQDMHIMLRELCMANAPGIRAGSYSHAPYRSPQTGDPSRHVLRNLKVRRQWGRVCQIAAGHGWRGPHLDGLPNLWLTQTPRKNPNWDEDETELYLIWQEWNQALMPETRTSHLCQTCHEANLRIHANGNYYCPACGWYGTAQEWRNLLHFRLVSAGEPIAREQIRRLYPYLKAGTVRVWIHRGLLTQDGEGRVDIKQLDTLANNYLRSRVGEGSVTLSGG